MKYLTPIFFILFSACNSGTTTQPPPDTVYIPKPYPVHDTIPRECPKCPPCKPDTVIKTVHDTVPRQCPKCIPCTPCKNDTIIKHDSIPYEVTKTVHDTIPRKCPACPPCKTDTVHDSIPIYAPCDSTRWNIATKDSLQITYIPLFTDNIIKKIKSAGKIEVVFTIKKQ
jgi:hypothetical protein